jgi:hypothetical protein
MAQFVDVLLRGLLLALVSADAVGGLLLLFDREG